MKAFRTGFSQGVRAHEKGWTEAGSLPAYRAGLEAGRAARARCAASISAAARALYPESAIRDAIAQASRQRRAAYTINTMEGWDDGALGYRKSAHVEADPSRSAGHDAGKAARAEALRQARCAYWRHP
jgi:hypothetical protein